jgi:hypothetical protein
MKKYGRGSKATNDNTIRRMPIVCWITKAADTHSVYFIVLLFHGNSGYANASPCCVILTLPDFYVLLSCGGLAKSRSPGSGILWEMREGGIQKTVS